MHTDAHSWAANSGLNVHPVQTYLDLSIQTIEENWFLRMCHQIIIVLWKHSLPKYKANLQVASNQHNTARYDCIHLCDIDISSWDCDFESSSVNFRLFSCILV